MKVSKHTRRILAGEIEAHKFDFLHKITADKFRVGGIWSFFLQLPTAFEQPFKTPLD